MHGDGEHIRIVLENRGRAVALVHVGVDDSHAFEAALALHDPHRDGNVVEDPRTNSLIVTDIPDQFPLIEQTIACLDVRSNDEGDLVVTKGDQYDVREGGDVRNLGKPVELAQRYFAEGADEVTFLNITGFRDFPLEDMPMLEVLRQTSQHVFVPLTIGGGIRDYIDKDGREYSALEVATEYFRSGADKVSIGSDAVLIVEDYLKTGRKTGSSAIEEISRVYGNQAVVISIDPRRVYAASPDDVDHQVGFHVDHLCARLLEGFPPGAVSSGFIIFQETGNVVGVHQAHGGSGDPSPYTAYGSIQGMKAALQKVFGDEDLSRALKLVFGGAGSH